MTNEHLIGDIQNVLEMCRIRRDGAHAERLRRAFEGLHRHVEGDPAVPERVKGCLEESVRVLGEAGDDPERARWEYARTCLEAALEYARDTSAPTPRPSTGPAT